MTAYRAPFHRRRGLGEIGYRESHVILTNMQVSPSPTPWSTVAALPDYLLLSQARQLARHEQALQILVLDHLREIEARRLDRTRALRQPIRLRRARRLDYTAAAAWRRIKAMRLCTETDSARELLQDGSLNLSNAAQLQNLFERSDRSRSRPPARHGAGGVLGGAPRNRRRTGGVGTAERRSAPASATRRPCSRAGAGRRGAGGAGQAGGRQEHARSAADAGRGGPGAGAAERPDARARRRASWELKAAVRRGVPAWAGEAADAAVAPGPAPDAGRAGGAAGAGRAWQRYDLERPRRSRRPGGGASVDGARTPSKPARRDTETVQRNVVRAKGSDVERRSKIERDDTVVGGRLGMALPVTSAPTAKCESEAELGRASRAVARDGGGRAVAAARRDTEAGHGGAKSAAVRDIVRRAASAPKRVTQDEHAHTEEAQRVRGAAASAPGRHREAEHACGQPQAMHGRGGRAASPAKRHGRADGEGRDAGVDGVPDRATCAAGVRFEADRRDASRVPARGGHRCSNSPAKRLAYAAGRGAVERSPALQRHLAALSCFGALPGSRSRYIPVAVKREVWRRDQGRCSYVDRHSGRRCGSRYRLEIDHIVPFALGGPTDLVNLRVRCRAHHRLRHAHAESVPPEGRRAPVLAVDPKERAWTVGPHAAIDRAGA